MERLFMTPSSKSDTTIWGRPLLVLHQGADSGPHLGVCVGLLVRQQRVHSGNRSYRGSPLFQEKIDLENGSGAVSECYQQINLWIAWGPMLYDGSERASSDLSSGHPCSHSTASRHPLWRWCGTCLEDSHWSRRQNCGWLSCSLKPSFSHGWLRSQWHETFWHLKNPKGGQIDIGWSWSLKGSSQLILCQQWRWFESSSFLPVWQSLLACEWYCMHLGQCLDSHVGLSRSRVATVGLGAVIVGSLFFLTLPWALWVKLSTSWSKLVPF
jgi:hypothetical protein